MTDQRAALLECAGAHYLVTIGRDDAQERITRLAEIARDVPGDPKGGIRVRENGPYLLTGGALMSNFLGEPTTAPPVAALCRCGRSESKPWCDGTHATIGFNDRKHPDRVADRLDTYAARQFTILDNRGICAHPDGALTRCPRCFASARSRLLPRQAGADDILRAIQACPSGRSERRSPSAAPPMWSIGFARPRLRSRRTGRITSPVAWISGTTPATSRCDRQVLERAFRPLSLRAVEEQALLQWRALVRRFPRSGDRPGPRANPLRVGGGYPVFLRDARFFLAPRPSR